MDALDDVGARQGEDVAVTFEVLGMILEALARIRGLTPPARLRVRVDLRVKLPAQARRALDNARRRRQRAQAAEAEAAAATVEAARELLEKYLASKLTPDDPPRSEAQKLLRQASGG